MHKRSLLLIILSVAIVVFGGAHAYAASPNVVISQVQLGDLASASNELIELYNNSDSAVDITGWCLYYASANSMTNGSKLGCMTTATTATHILLPAKTYALAVSTQLASNNPSMNGDIKFSATLSGTAGHVRLLNSESVEIDKIGWGATALSPEGNAAFVPANGLVLTRINVGDTHQDSDNNMMDFQMTTPRLVYSYDNIYKVTDVCTNIDGIQQMVPDGFIIDQFSSCISPTTDLCSNMGGMQTVLPPGFLLDGNGGCQFDVCANIDGLQTDIPAGYQPSLGQQCVEALRLLKVNELLSNVSGADEGHEFIELYNPNDVAIDMSRYILEIGQTSQYHIHFDALDMIAAHGYKVLYNDTYTFTLVNTQSLVKIIGDDGSLIDQSVLYDSPAEDLAWALIGGGWQYTNQPTPNAQNLASQQVVSGTTNEDIASDQQVSTLKQCAANQYRNLETNRCRLITTLDFAEPCKDGQYRSEETNRCRNLASDVTVYTACAEGQERNPDTNRCRNVTSSTVPKADFAVLGTQTKQNNNYVLWAIIGVAVLALAYAMWEWRQEVRNIIRKIRRFFTIRK
jgi:hypothetical protein